MDRLPVDVLSLLPDLKDYSNARSACKGFRAVIDADLCAWARQWHAGSGLLVKTIMGFSFQAPPAHQFLLSALLNGNRVLFNAMVAMGGHGKEAIRCVESSRRLYCYSLSLSLEYTPSN